MLRIINMAFFEAQCQVLKNIFNSYTSLALSLSHRSEHLHHRLKYYHFYEIPYRIIIVCVSMII